jgi:FKBP-type peptidyl-prolyl cis-trans isomerase FkpA
MKKAIYMMAAAAAFFTVSCGKYKKTASGIQYQVIERSGDATPNSDTTSLLFANYRISIQSNDSVLFETFSKDKPGYIPVFEPTMKEALMDLVKGDSAEVIINVDTFFLNSFGQPRPPFVKEGDNIRFILKIKDIMSQEDMRKKEMQEMQELSVKDSVDQQAALAALPNKKEAGDGIFYTTLTEGKGKQVKKGSKVVVLYKGMLLNGQVFDENQKEGYDVTVGLGQVIPGWETMLLQMKEGQKVKAIIPWEQAYGGRGSGPIPPFSTLMFEMEVISVK